MKVIKIESECDDYWAMTFEQHGTASEKNWNLAKETNKLIITLPDGKEVCMNARAYEFSDVDPKFISFVYDMMDYDMLKQTNFFIVK